MLSGQDVDQRIGNSRVRFEEVSLNIDDGRSVGKIRGVPAGVLSGGFDGSGEVTVSTRELDKIIKEAEQAGAFTKLPTFDCLWVAKAGSTTLKIEAFGCLFKLSDLLNAKADGGEKLVHKLPFMITEPDFIHINDVPYIDPDLTNDL